MLCAGVTLNVVVAETCEAEDFRFMVEKLAEDYNMSSTCGPILAWLKPSLRVPYNIP